MQFAVSREYTSPLPSIPFSEPEYGIKTRLRIAGAVFGNELSKNLEQYAAIIPAEVITGVKQSVTVIFMLPELLQGVVITAYIKAVAYAFLVTVPGGALTLIFGLFVKNWNLKERGVKPGAAVA